VIKQQFVFQKTRLRGMAKNRFKIFVLAALTNLFLGRSRLLATAQSGEWCTSIGSTLVQTVENELKSTEISTSSVHQLSPARNPELA
jgi:hypothetical protein